MLNILYLVEQGLLDIPVLYLSRYIMETRAQYYRYLAAVTTDEAWEDWILYILGAVHVTSLWTTSKIKAIRDLIELTAETMRQQTPKIYSRELAELIFVHPYCRIADVVAARIALRQSASSYLKSLARIGILSEVQVGREKLFINPSLLKVLSDTEGRSGSLSLRP